MNPDERDFCEKVAVCSLTLLVLIYFALLVTEGCHRAGRMLQPTTREAR